MGKKKLGLVLALDGEKEFKQQVTSINKTLTAMKTELSLVSAKYDGQANSIKALTEKGRILNKIFQEQTNKAGKTKEALQAAEKRCSSLEKTTKGLRSALNKEAASLDDLKQKYEEAKQRLSKMTQEGNSSERAMQKQRGTIKVLGDAIKKQEKNLESANERLEKSQNEYRKCGNIVNDWKGKLNTAEAQVIKANAALEKNAAYLKEAERSTDGCATSIDEFGKKVRGAVETTESFSQSVKEGFGEAVGSKALDLLSDGIEIVKESMYDLSGASAKLAASTGLSESAAKKYQQVMQQIKGDNFGESYEDIADTMSEIIQIMGELDPDAMTETTESAIALRDTFNMDINESIRAADVMMKTMGVDATTAFDLIAKGAQNGLNRSGELTDNITEYAQIWGQAGFSAEEMFAILENGLDAGAYNLDKVNDYVKEFGNSLADGRIEKNLGYFSDGTKKLFESWKNGEASTSDVFYSVIDDLSEMTNQQEALTIASEVWSALGEDNAMQVITALDDVNDKYKNVRGTMDSLKEVRYDDLESAVSGLGSAVQENIVAPIAEAVLPKITELFQTATDVVEGIGEAINPQKTIMEEFVESIEQANDDIETTIENADSTMQNAELEAGKIETLGTQLLSLNSVEDKSLAQKYQLREIVSQLGATIPEIAAAYDEEAGKVQLTDSAIQQLIGSTKELMIAQAAQNAMQEIANQLLEAEVALADAETSKSVAEDRIKILEEEKALMEDLKKQYELDPDDNAFQTKQLEFWTEKLNEGKISVEEFNEATQNLGYAHYSEHMAENAKQTARWTEASEELDQNITELEGNVEAAEDRAKSYEKTVQDVTDKINGESGSLRDNADSSAYAAAEKDKIAAACGKTAEAVGAEKDAIDEATESVDHFAEAHAQANQNILDAYNNAVSQIESDLQNKISLFDKFDGGEDMTTEEINANLQSHLDGLTNYQENLEKVKGMTDETGKAIFSPEVLAKIEEGGTDYANMLKHFVTTFEEQGEYGVEQLRGINDKWAESIDMTESMAEVQAANKIAFEMLTGELGSSEADFSALRKSIEGAVSGPLNEELNNAVDAAQQCGIKIPEGLAEGIANGTISPEAALEQLNGSLAGSFDALAEVAKNAGIGDDILAELASGIESGGQDAVDAYSNLISLIAGKSPELQKALDKGVETNGVTSSIESTAGEAADALTSQTDSFRTAGQILGEAVLEGLSEALESGEGALILDPSSISDKAGEYSDAGRELGQAIVKGLKDTQDDINNAVSPNLSNMDTSSATQAGTALGQAVATAAMETSQSSANAGSLLGQMTANGALKELQKMQEAGQKTAQKYADAVKAAGSGAASAGNSLGSRARAAVASYDGAFYSAGYNMASGVASGIRGGSSGAISAAVSMAAQALAAAKAELDIHSPSRKFRKEVGQQISAGMAFGISDKASLAGKQAKKLSSRVYNNATAWLTKYKKKQKVSLADEKWYWQQVAKHTKSGTVAYSNAMKKIQQIKAKELTATGISSVAAGKIVGNFGVSKTTKSGKKTKTKDTETYYSEVYSAAEKYLSNQKVLNDWSLKQELAYWKAVKGQLISGTQAWYDATKQINALNDEIAEAAKERIATQANVQRDILDKYKVYNDVSAKAEMQYWDIARKQFKAGTDERVEADENYLKAKEDYYDQQTELAEKYAEDQKKINDDLADDVKNLQDTYEDAVKSRKKDILSSMNLFESWDAGGYDKATLTANLRTQVEGVRFWEQQLEELGKKNISQDLLDELTEMGPEAAANIWSLNQMTAKELEEYNALWAEKNNLAHKQAVADNEKLLKETNDAISEARKAAQDELAALEKDYRAAVAELNAGLSDGLKSLVNQAGKIGEEIVSRLVNVIKDAKTTSSIKSAVSSANKIINSSQNPLYEAPAPKTATKTKTTTTKAATASKTTPKKDETAEQKKRIQAIINSGKARSKKLTAKEKKQHVALWEYIASKYGRTATKAMYVSLGKELGVETSKKPTNAQKNAILKKLKAKGFASGTKRIKEDDEYWIHPGELLVRKADNGIYKTLHTGEGVIPEKLTENLMEWGKKKPVDFLASAQAAMERRQAALADQMDKLNHTGIAKLNMAMETYRPQATVVNVDNGNMAGMIQQLAQMLPQAIADALTGLQMVTDTGVLAGQMQRPLSQENAAVEIRRRRGRL